MAVGAIHSLITADNSDYRAALHAMESDTGRSMGRIGGIVKSQTKGWRDLASAAAGVGAGIGVAFGAFRVGQQLREVFDEQSRVNRAVETERDLRAQATLQIEKALRLQRERLGDAKAPGANLASVVDTSSLIAAEIAKAQARAREAAGELLALQDLFGQDGTIFGFDLRDAAGLRATIDEATSSARYFADAMRESNAQMEKAAELDRKLAEAEALKGRMEREASRRSMERGDRVAILQLEGREIEALREQERQRFRDALEAITKLEAASGASDDMARERAQRRHDEEMERIGREAGARAKAQDMANDLSGMELDAQEARLSGDTERAKILEEEVRLRREIETIRNAGGLSDQEKNRRIEQAGRISALRLGGEADGGRQRTVTASLEAGVQRTGGTLSQVFGGIGAFDVQKTIDQTTRKQLSVTEAIRTAIDTIVRGGLRTEARAV
jgi:hypothetical protein